MYKRQTIGQLDTVTVQVGLWQDDPLAPLRFSITFQAIVNNDKVDQGKTIFNEMMQILGYADDAILGRSLLCVKEAFWMKRHPKLNLE